MSNQQIPPNFDPDPLSPLLIIKDADGVLQYTYESKRVKSSLPLLQLVFRQNVRDLVGDNDGVVKPNPLDGTPSISNNEKTGLNATGWDTEVWATQFTELDSTSVITAISLDVGVAAGNVRVKIYKDDAQASPAPTDLLGETDSIAVGGTGIQTFTFTTPIQVPAGGKVWIAFECDSATLDLVHAAVAATTKVVHTYGAGPDPFGTPVTDTIEPFLQIHILPKLVGSPLTTSDNEKTGSNQIGWDTEVWAAQFTGLDSSSSIIAISLDVVTAVGKVRVKLYQDDGSDAPSTLLGQSSSLSVGGTGVQTFTFPSKIQIPAGGKIWAAFECDSATLDLVHAAVASTNKVTHTYGTGPDPFGTPVTDTVEPFIQILVQPNNVSRDLVYDSVDSEVDESSAVFDDQDFVEIPNESKFDITRILPFSIAFKYKPQTGGAGNDVIFSKTDSITGVGYVVYFDYTTRFIHFRIIDDGSTVFEVVSSALTLDQYERVYCTKGIIADQNDMRIYLGATLDATGSSSAIGGGATFANAIKAHIGALSDGTLLLKGKLDFVSFYTVQLSQTQVTELNSSFNPYMSTTKTTAAIQDFELGLGVGHIGVNDDQGQLTLNIWDNDNLLVTADGNRSPKIKGHWDVQLYLGKNGGNMQRWFYGKVLEVEVFRDKANLQELRVIVGGWGVRTMDRVTSIRRFQNTLADGVELDVTDNKSKVSELFKDIFEDTDHHPYRGLPKETSISVHPHDIDLKLADLVELAQTWSHVVSRLAGFAGAFHFIDCDRQAHLHQILSQDSGFLFTNDLSALSPAQNWDSELLAIIKRDTLSWKNSNINAGYSVLHGVGATVDEKDQDLTSAEDAVFDMSTKHIAVEFQPTQSSLSKIALNLRKFGDPLVIGDAFIKIVPLTSSGGSNAPIDTDAIKRVRIPVEKLAALSDLTDSFLEIAFEKITLDTDRFYAVIFEKYGTTLNTIEWAYRTSLSGGTLNFWESDDGLAWGAAQAGDFTLRTYPQRKINLILVNTTAINRFGIREKILPLRDLPNDKAARDLLVGLSGVFSKARRIMPPININAPTNRIPIGKYVRIKDVNGLDVKADIIGVDFNLNADSTDNIGVNTVKVTVQGYI